MRLDSGRGAVVFKNIPVIADTLLVGEIALPSMPTEEIGGSLSSF